MEEGSRILTTGRLFLFLVYSINSNYFRQKALSFSSGSTRQRIQLTQLKKFKLILPPFSECNEIAEFLEKQTTQFDELIAKSKAQITLLEEKRQALITATVTGKIDVRSEVVA